MDAAMLPTAAGLSALDAHHEALRSGKSQKDCDVSVHNEGANRAGHVAGVTSMSRETKTHSAPSGRYCRKPAISQPPIMKSSGEDVRL